MDILKRLMLVKSTIFLNSKLIYIACSNSLHLHDYSALLMLFWL